MYLYLMGRAVSLRIHDTLLKVTLDFSGKRFGDVTDGQKAVTVNTGGTEDTGSSVDPAASALRNFELDPEIFVLVLKLFNDGMKSGKFVFKSSPRRTVK